MARFLIALYRIIFARRMFYRLNTFIYGLSLRGIGVLNYENGRVSGEEAFLRAYLKGRESPVVLDVGANVGEFAETVMRLCPQARIYAFEPHPDTFLRLRSAAERHRFKPFDVACSDREGKATLYDYSDEDGSSHASLFAGVIEDIHRRNATSHSVKLIRLDDFVGQFDIDIVDLLKIDTEGNEVNVLKGFERHIAASKVLAIHFEFGEMNVISRTFFRDYSELLDSYEFYRMLPDGLVHLGAYQPRSHEIFAYQNLVAMLRDSKPRRRPTR